MRGRNNGYIHTDTALEEMQSILDTKKDWDIEKGAINSSSVEYFITVKGIPLRLWFDYDKQIYGFDMLNGGSKTGRTLDTLFPLFESYVKLNTELVPIAKLIVVELDTLYGIKALFTGINGNNTNGYSAVFNILETEGTVSVRQIGDEYVAEVVRGTDDTEEFKFIVDNDSVILVEDKELTPFEEMLQGYDVNVGENDTVIVNLDEYEAKILLRDSLNNGVNLVGGTLGTKSLDFLMEHPIFIGYGMSYIEDIAKDKYGVQRLLLECLQQNYNVPLEKASISGKGVLLIDGNEVNCIEDYLNLKEKLSSIDTLIDESQDQPDGAEDEVMNPPDCTEASDESKSFITKLMYEGEYKGVQIKRGTELYSISTDIALSVGLGQERILDETAMIVRNGVLVSEDEVALHRFARRVEESADIYELLDCLF